MSIIRAPRPIVGWYCLDRRISEDARLSWAARGLLVFLLGKPDNWRVSVEHLRRQTADARIRTGRDGIYALLDELKVAGYIEASRQRRGDGTLGPLCYLVREAPLPAQPDVAEPDTAQPDTAGTTLENTERAVETKKAPNTDSTEERGKIALQRNAEHVPARFDPATADLVHDVGRDVLIQFCQHRRELGKPVTTEGWEQLRARLRDLWEKGADLNEALRTAMAAGYPLPPDPRRGKAAVIERRRDRQERDTAATVAWHDRNVPPSRADREGAWTPN
ncbi:hypothetical protein FQY83_14215 [Luteimonas marina]|uniref:Helix-turn-helix domain-containing protein n=1 Tax=Luteimonas marina TaxID=488485 RepID=A0A5C5TZD4_9GAMM|nr:hypothetical protein [Luteimonas marina]TWT18530.1 hypothetical protein FQY83_14215 [Luteimonas marina]